MTNSTFNLTCLYDGSVNVYVCMYVCMYLFIYLLGPHPLPPNLSYGHFVDQEI